MFEMLAPTSSSSHHQKFSRQPKGFPSSSWWWWLWLWRSWFGYSTKLTPTRRLLTPQLFCRLPLLALWTLIAIFILYKTLAYNDLRTASSSQGAASRSNGVESIGDNNNKNIAQGPVLPVVEDISSRNSRPDGSQMLQRRSSLQHYNTSDITDLNVGQHPYQTTNTTSASGDVMNENVILSRSHLTDQTESQFPSTTTRRSTATDYARQSRVFILIIQNDEHQPPTRAPRGRSPLKTSLPSPSSYSSLAFVHGTVPPERQNSFITPHIRILIDILEAHRIGYSIGTTKAGLPTELLTDQDNSSDNKQYSVIIIDDFIKYTRLNRWIRDQLDRHCRVNKIGVVTYLTPEQLERQKLDSNHTYLRSNLTKIIERRGASPTSSKEAESLADQFPLTFKLIDQQACRNSSSTSCLINYQLNERSPILRMLKRKPNFVLNEPLVANINQSPWVAMLSNHVTYEPLTWAKFRDPYAKSGHIDNNLQSFKRKRRHSLSLASMPDDLMRANSEKTKSESVKSAVSEDSSKLLLPSSKTIDFGDDDQQRVGPGLDVTQGYDENQVHPDSAQQSTVPSLSLSEDSSFFLREAIGPANYLQNFQSDNEIERQILSMFDQGLYDGIKRVIFGGANHHWLNRILLLDSIEHLSSGKIISPLDRYIQIDIDDIFVGERGKRMNHSDVEALIEAQREFANRFDGGFRFNLGFSGKYFKHGSEEENAGDLQLISRANEFTWFCHTWSHSKAHLANKTETIVSELRKNLDFAQEHKLPIIGQLEYTFRNEGDRAYRRMAPTYAVAPHHSGVYPIHEQLYDAWRDVLNVQVTSTEEYPRLRPASSRRSFVHKTIKVLQRQTCGLYTHTIYRHKYPGGIGRLESSIKGGELFETVLHNPVNIYMTHMSNYAKDRLALSTFSALFDFVQSNTNLQLKFALSSSPAHKVSAARGSHVDNNDSGLRRRRRQYRPELPQLGPALLADYYFDIYPAERQPLWTNPCQEKRHLDIWAPEKHAYCNQVPRLLIVGPQKTGTTALYTYLKMNPIFKSSQISPVDYEEIQFFNDKHYFKGVDWYFSRFNINHQGSLANSTTSGQQYHDGYEGEESRDGGAGYYHFDKSATYLDDPKVPRRARHLLPEARIIMLLVNPADRAYSWYQHVKAHGDPSANLLSFEQVIMAKEDDSNLSPATKALQNRCLHPGYYSQHLSNWLAQYPSRQIIIIDGQWFRYNPASVMNRLQLLLRVEKPLDYNKLLVYDKHKGFYCQKDQLSGEIKCLGPSKGRKYPPMSQDARLFLNRHYWAHNRQLARLLSDIGQPLPTWLDETIGLVSHVSPVIY